MAGYLAPDAWYLLHATWHHATCTIWHLIAVIPGATWRANDSGKVAAGAHLGGGTWLRPLWVLPSPGSHTPARRRQWYPPIYPLLCHFDPSVISTPQCFCDIFIWSCYWLDILCDNLHVLDLFDCRYSQSSFLKKAESPYKLSNTYSMLITYFSPFLPFVCQNTFFNSTYWLSWVSL